MFFRLKDKLMQLDLTDHSISEMTKLTETLFRQKNSFLPIYGFNHSQKNGRKMEKNPPTFNSILNDEEKKKARRIEVEELNCKEEIDQVLNCLSKNGKIFKEQLKELSDCYHRSFDDELAIKIYNAQLEIILKNSHQN